MAETGQSQARVVPVISELKVPKGTRDWFGADVILRDHIFQTISEVFKRHGGTALDTPVFELREVLTGKYGEDSKLIYDLADQGGELAALRFDLTVPFARWLAMNNVTQIKRYQISKVYRRDQPAIARGRMREFYQCDFDIAGETDPMIPDSEILRIIIEVFKALELDVTIKLNHRKVLDGLFAVAGVPADKIRATSSAVDKLDKMPWVEVKKEMVESKGIPDEVADRIGEYVQQSGPIADMLERLQADSKLTSNDDVKAGLSDLSLLVTYLQAMGVADKISFDLSLARGLDYYTGLIYECVVGPTAATEPNASAPKSKSKSKSKKSDDPSSLVGSIGAGGRYDNLVGVFGKRTIPCVGISFGVDRIFTILKAKREREAGAAPRTRETDVYVMAFGGKGFDGLLAERMSVISALWDAGIRAEFSPKVKPRLPQQFKAAADVPLAVILGQDELAAGKVKIKVLGLESDHPEKEGVMVDRADVAAEVRKRLPKP
ncbi:histidyl-tRNA mitochondrial precursor [Eremomyces bilateralis CBS 781.70]|uniref:Histidine--tRNA ligase, mitochondrial n=1 Tax=Eremomyces bilateralis CBS 781.70 TaxID=1392243 RepID=A0A6G1G6L5_9PEZI|nr:histidyl-tRNA mitochondrial precursor [Eremomyces bilateralis CBS 781.70]KAF1813479.1 histidyl-tRNA mitochondrial precursor [Eremomyces bilateralis CBS 781.70]